MNLTWHDNNLSREERRSVTREHLWFTGLSGSENLLLLQQQKSNSCVRLPCISLRRRQSEVRANEDLNFSAEDRHENVREFQKCKAFRRRRSHSTSSLISPYLDDRQRARSFMIDPV